MKADAATVDLLRQAIAPYDTPDRREVYRIGAFPRADAVQDLDKRYRWDLFGLAGSWRLGLYDKGLNDVHIDTALRSLVPPLDPPTTPKE